MQETSTTKELRTTLSLLHIKLNFFKRKKHIQGLLTSVFEFLNEVIEDLALSKKHLFNPIEETVGRLLKTINENVEILCKKGFFGSFCPNLSGKEEIILIFSAIHQINLFVSALFPQYADSPLLVELHLSELENLDAFLKRAQAQAASGGKEINNHALSSKLTSEYAYIFWALFFPCENTITGTQFMNALREIFINVKGIKLTQEHLKLAHELVDPMKHHAVTPNDINEFFSLIVDNENNLREFLYSDASRSPISKSEEYKGFTKALQELTFTAGLTVVSLSTENPSLFEIGQIFKFTQKGLEFTKHEKQHNIFLGEEPGVIRFGRKGRKFLSQNDVYFHQKDFSVSRKQFQLIYSASSGGYKLICLSASGSPTGLKLREDQPIMLEEKMVLQFAGENLVIIEKITYRTGDEGAKNQISPKKADLSKIRQLSREQQSSELEKFKQKKGRSLKGVQPLNSADCSKTMISTDDSLHPKRNGKKKVVEFLSEKMDSKEGDNDSTDISIENSVSEQELSFKNISIESPIPLGTFQENFQANSKVEKPTILGVLVSGPALNKEKRYYFCLKESQIITVGFSKEKSIKLSGGTVQDSECEIFYDSLLDKISVKAAKEVSPHAQPALILIKNQEQYELDLPSDAVYLQNGDQIYVEGTCFEYRDGS